MPSTPDDGPDREDEPPTESNSDPADDRTDDAPDGASSGDEVEERRSVSAALTVAGRLLVDRPGEVLPAYLLALGVGAVARTPLLVGLGVAAALLAATGRLEPLVRAVGDVATAVRRAGESGGAGARGSPGFDPEALPPETVAAVGDALAAAATPGVLAALAVAGVGAVLAGLLARAVASAVAFGTVRAGVAGRAPLVEGVRAAGRWRTFLGLALVRALVLAVAVGLPLVAGVGVAVLVGGDPTAGGVPRSPEAVGAELLLAALAALALVGLAAVLALVGLFLLLFAEPAAVVDDVGTVDAVRASLGFVRENPGRAVVFGLVAVGSYLAAGAATGAASVAGASRLGALVLGFALAPLLDAAATALYAGVPVDDSKGGRTADRDRERGVAATATRLRAAFAGGVGSFGGFVRGHPLATVVAAGALAVGAAGGYVATVRMGTTVPPPADVAGVFGAVPVGPFVTIAANNWLVGAGLAAGGLAAGVPAVVGLAFNGVLVGALAGVTDRTAFLALVAPHGVVELPALAVVGGVGVHLGRVGGRALRGRADAEAVATELGLAWRVLLGAAVVLVVAAAIEAFVTPWVAALVLG